MSAPSVKYVRALPSFIDVHRRIVEGESITHIAQTLMDAGEIEDDVDLSTLVYRLRAYRGNVAKLELVAPHRPAIVQEAIEHIERSLSEMDAMENLYVIQLGRLQRALEEEADGPMNAGINQYIATAASLLTKRHDIKMDLGYDGGRDLGTMSVRPEIVASVEETYGIGAVEVLQSPKKRARVLALAKRLVAAASAEQ